MNRFFTLAGSLLIHCFSSQAQVADKNKTENQPSIAQIYESTADTATEHKLVTLALKSPVYSGSNHQNRINELELTRAKNAWLNLLTFSASINPQTFSKAPPQSTYVYPPYFFTISIPLGIIFSQGNQVKMAREGLALSKENQEELSRTLKADILSKYKQYKLYTELLKMQSIMINDVLANATQAEENFRNGKINVESYIATQKVTNDELTKNMNLKLQRDLIKIEIEKMIGVPLETVLSPTTRK
jgi:hypothetical protein